MAAPGSQYLPIVNGVSSLVSAQGLTDWNAQFVPVSVRKLPKAEEVLDPLPQLLVCPHARPESIKRISFEGGYAVTYRVEVVTVAAGDRDFTASHLDYYAGWREAIRPLFQKPAAMQGVIATVFDCTVDPEPILDRGELPDGYDAGSLSLLITNIEQG